MDFGFFPFAQSVHARVDSLVACTDLHPQQRVLLDELLQRMRTAVALGGYSQPLGLLYWAYRAWEGRPSERTEWLGAFCTLCMCSLDLFDDVQDDDLEGKPCAEVGAPIATNTALALMFVAVKALSKAQEAEPSAERRAAYMRAFNRFSLVCVGAQHADLMGEAGATTPSEVMARDSGKTAVVALFLELGALGAGCVPAVVKGYRGVGRKLASLAQIVDDLRDLYAKAESPDLKTGKLTYPLACYYERANEQEAAHLRSLIARLPDTFGDIGDLLYAGGAVEACALTLERLRAEIHDELLAMGNRHGGQRMLLRMVDDLCQSIYSVESLDTVSAFWQPTGSFGVRLADSRRVFIAHARAWEVPELPTLVPWPHAYFFTQAERGICFYPDFDDLPEEVSAAHVMLQRATGAARTVDALSEHADYFVAHEMFHAWRAAASRVSADHWHEEYVCDRLAVAYLGRFFPDSLCLLSEHAARLIEQNQMLLSDECRDLAASASRASVARTCELDPVQTSLWHALVVLQVSQEVQDFAVEMRGWLGAVEQRLTAA